MGLLAIVGQLGGLLPPQQDVVGYVVLQQAQLLQQLRPLIAFLLLLCFLLEQLGVASQDNGRDELLGLRLRYL